MSKNKTDCGKLIGLPDLEEILYQDGYQSVCGVDEVGRGPLAGPVVAAAVVLPRGVSIPGVDDSKKLSALRREELFEFIIASGVPCAVGIIDHETIDKINILRASLMAMKLAVSKLPICPDCLLVDGCYGIPHMRQAQFAIIEGDARVQSIGAASIVAKVTRDRIMAQYQELYPQFSFTDHKGYPTPQHLQELEQHGPCAIHRRTFRPVAVRIEQYALFEK